MNEKIARIEPPRDDYRFPNAEGDHTRHYLWAPILRILKKQKVDRAFDLGCGNGAFVRHMRAHNIDTMGVDPSEKGIAIAKKTYPGTPVDVGNGYEPLADRFGTFPAVVSLEVVGHVYYPRQFAHCISDLLEPGGIAIISTPYHSYCKNLMLALSGRLEQHFGPLWDHGMIKFWSVDTLTQLFEEVGLKRTQVLRVGRLPVIAMSMILVFQKPQ